MPKINLAYPKMPGSKNTPDARCIAFEKHDGTNLHWVWHRELGWYAYGTRRDRFDLDERGIAEFNEAHPGMTEAPVVFRETWAELLEKVFREHQAYSCDEIVVFAEFLGPNSFAGMHKADDPKELVLFDVQIETGIIGPQQFVDDFGHLPIAQVVYIGRLTGKFINDVRDGKYAVAEGVVCKGGNVGDVWMVKVKTNAYMEKLKAAFAADWEQYWE